MRGPTLLLAILLVLPASAGHASAEGSPPRIDSVAGPGNGTIENPLTIVVMATDPDGGGLTYLWYLDGEMVATGPNLTYYLFPGTRNVTVVITDPDQDSASLSWTFSAIPPAGWEDRPDDASNRAMFWTIFGSAGAFLVLALAFILFRKDAQRPPNMDRKSR